MKQPIKIEILDIDSYYRKMEKYFLQHFHSNKTLILLLIHFVFGLSLLISGLSNGYDIEVMTLKNGQEEVTLKNYGIFIGIGCGLILYSFLKFLEHRKSKKSTQLLYSIHRNRQKKENSKLQFKLTTDEINCISNLNNWTKKWEYYDSYKIADNFLNLYSNSYNCDFPELMLPLDNLNSEQLVSLNKYLNQKLKYYS